MNVDGIIIISKLNSEDETERKEKKGKEKKRKIKERKR
jgi:hypothetical protein